jgi:hypothetical protein
MPSTVGALPSTHTVDGGEHKEIQFRNRSNETLAFNCTAWSDNGKGSDGSSIALQPNEISDTHRSQLKGAVAIEHYRMRPKGS